MKKKVDTNFLWLMITDSGDQSLQNQRHANFLDELFCSKWQSQQDPITTFQIPWFVSSINSSRPRVGKLLFQPFLWLEISMARFCNQISKSQFFFIFYLLFVLCFIFIFLLFMEENSCTWHVNKKCKKVSKRDENSNKNVK